MQNFLDEYLLNKIKEMTGQKGKKEKIIISKTASEVEDFLQEKTIKSEETIDSGTIEENKSSTNKKKRGIVDECCLNPCGPSELKSYCPY